MNNNKYRAWDSLNEQMVYSDKEDCFYINTKGVLFMYAIPKSESGLETLYHKSYDVDQFTGLQDKNGVDIYEGDIVKSSGNNSLYFISFGLHSLTGFYFDEEGEEVSCTGFFCSRQGSYPDDIESLCNKSNIYLEVIGNIHQNPELLETK